MIHKSFRVAAVAALCVLAALSGAACKSGPDDTALATSVKSKVASEPGVVVAVKDGVVTLSGTAATEAAKAKAAAEAKSVEGVKSVTNNITVLPAAPATPPAAMGNDAAIKAAVESSLAKANVTGVTVTVENGVATLSGTVPKAQWQKAMMAANEATPKPTQVKNAMTEK